MGIFVASTLTSSQNYVTYEKGNIVSEIVIHGGNSMVGHALVTIEGIITKITEQEREALSRHPVFKVHLKNGFVKFTDQGDASKATSDLESRDAASPLTQQDVDNLQDDSKTNVNVDFDDPVKKTTRGRKK